MPQPRSAPRPASFGSACSSRAEPGSSRFQLKMPGCDHSPPSASSRRAAPSERASSMPSSAAGRAPVQGAVVTLGGLLDRTAEAGELGREPRPAHVLRRHRGERRAGRQRPQHRREIVPPLQRARRRQHDHAAESALRDRGEIGGAGDEGRILPGAVRDGGEGGRGGDRRRRRAASARCSTSVERRAQPADGSTSRPTCSKGSSRVAPRSSWISSCGLRPMPLKWSAILVPRPRDAVSVSSASPQDIPRLGVNALSHCPSCSCKRIDEATILATPGRRHESRPHALPPMSEEIPA